MWTLDLTLLLTMLLLAYVGLRSHWTTRLLILLLLSPVLRYGMTIFGVPIRLLLSTYAGDLLRLAGFNILTVGNTLISDGAEMAVDPACMGLHLTGISLLVATGWVVWSERQAEKRVPLPWLLVYGIAAFGLTVLCNLIRIMLLVVFRIAPTDPWHEGVGLVCLLAYAWLPMLGLARYLVKHSGRSDWPAPVQTSRLAGGVGVAILSLGIWVSWLTGRPTTTAVAHHQHAGYICQTLANGYLQCSRPGVLIYEKPLPDWWSAEHSPTACWTGSGYALQRVRETHLGKRPAYVAELHRNGQVLYTAWWFSNGQYQTTSQLNFRWHMAQTTWQTDAPVFRLVNITAGSWVELEARCREWN